MEQRKGRGSGRSGRSGVLLYGAVSEEGQDLVRKTGYAGLK